MPVSLQVYVYNKKAVALKGACVMYLANFVPARTTVLWGSVGEENDVFSYPEKIKFTLPEDYFFCAPDHPKAEPVFCDREDGNGPTVWKHIRRADISFSDVVAMYGSSVEDMDTARMLCAFQKGFAEITAAGQTFSEWIVENEEFFFE